MRPCDANSITRDRWPWCQTHNHPMNAWDPGGDWYCWDGFRKGEVDDCDGRVVEIVVKWGTVHHDASV
jgi:hypothetical protein